MKRRRTELGLSQRQAARLADDLSPTTWGGLEKHHSPVSDLTAAAISQALGWTADSIARILDGEEPVESGIPPATPRDLASRVTALEQEVQEVRSLLTEVLSDLAAARSLLDALQEPHN